NLPAILRRQPSLLAACLAVALVGVFFVALNAPVGRKNSLSSMGLSSSKQPRAETIQRETGFSGDWYAGAARRNSSARAPGGPSAAPPAPPPDERTREMRAPVTEDARVEPPVSPPDRVVVRKATIELESPDVRAAFAKAAMLVSEAGGEYVQES